MLMYVTCEQFAAFMRLCSNAGSAREGKKRPFFIITRHGKYTPAFEGLLAQWLLRYIDLFAAGGVSDAGISFRY